MKLSYEDRLGTLRRHIKQGTLIRGSFTAEDKKGRAAACLLAAMSPEVASSEAVRDCPANVMPAWLAELTPHIDDEGTDKHWFSMVTRYAAVAALWPVLSKADWFGLEVRAWQIAITEYGPVMPKELHAWFMEMYSSPEAYRRVRRRLLCRPPVKSEKGRWTVLRRPQSPLEKKVLADLVKWEDSGAGYTGSRKPACIHGELQTMLAGPGEVRHAWMEASYSFNSNTSSRMAWDRMTNLLFDAIEAQVKVAKERQEIKDVALSKRPRS